MAVISNEKYGYARCSTNEKKQDIDRQKRELKALGVKEDNIFWEYESGTKDDRIELNKLMKIVRPGDTIVSLEVSRLTRSTAKLCEILREVKEKHLCLLIGSFVVDCRSDEIDPMTKGMLMMWGVFAEMEHDIICQRVKSGMENAKAKGKKIGRPTVNRDTLPTSFLKYYPQYKEGKINVTEFAKLADVSRKTIYKYIDIAEA